MKNKISSIVLVMCLAIPCAFMLTGCGDDYNGIEMTDNYHILMAQYTGVGDDYNITSYYKIGDDYLAYTGSFEEGAEPGAVAMYLRGNNLYSYDGTTWTLTQTYANEAEKKVAIWQGFGGCFLLNYYSDSDVKAYLGDAAPQKVADAETREYGGRSCERYEITVPAGTVMTNKTTLYMYIENNKHSDKNVFEMGTVTNSIDTKKFVYQSIVTSITSFDGVDQSINLSNIPA